MKGNDRNNDVPWTKHTASVPKGFLRAQVLRLLKERPMAGSEIVSQIEEETDGRWKPSPGSIYPLLTWLQKKQYTHEIRSGVSGIRRYELTQRGKLCFEEQVKLGKEIRNKLNFWAPIFVTDFWFSSHPERMPKFRQPVRRFIGALLNLREMLEENISNETLDEVASFLDSMSKQMEDITNRNSKENRNEVR